MRGGARAVRLAANPALTAPPAPSRSGSRLSQAMRAGPEPLGHDGMASGAPGAPRDVLRSPVS